MPRTTVSADGDAAVKPEDSPPPIPSDFATRYTRFGPDSFVSWGHAGGHYAGTIYVSAAGKAWALKPDGVAPPGAAAVMTTVDRAARKPGPTYYMAKAAADAGGRGGWQFGALGASAAGSDDPRLCARCHAEAQHDSFFLPPD